MYGNGNSIAFYFSTITMTKQELKIFVEETILIYPIYKKQIIQIYINALSEIEQGENEFNECYFARCEIKDFIHSKYPY